MRMMLRRISACLFVALSSMALLPAQEQCTYQQVDGATATAVGVLWSHGFDDDDVEVAGLARVLAACRLERVRRLVPNTVASGMRIGSDYSLVFGVVAGGDAKLAAQFLSTLLDEQKFADVLSDDVIALAVARAALAADDAESVYPGDVLLTRARQHFGRGTALARPPAGMASAIAKLTSEAVREALRVDVPVRMAALGVVTAGVIDAIRPLAATFETRVRGAFVCADSRASTEMTEDRNDRVDSPYVSAAFALPAEVDRAALAVGVQVATSRAFRRWRMRGMEQRARAPFVAWSWLHADPLLRLCRRGEEPSQLLPGERPQALLPDEVRATRAELQAFLQNLRTVPPSEIELGPARLALRSRLSLPGPGQKSSWAGEPATLPGRLQVLLLAAHHGVDVARIDNVTASQVHAAIKSVLQTDRSSWHSLLPASKKVSGYRRR
ncbi:MAG: hypothetical protein ACI91B_002858 [Planctomycetota bacterium]|jgi:hypothetical protein